MSTWDAYWDERIDKVNENVPMDEVLQDYDVPLRRTDTDIQFPCPLHGDGKDKNKSARYYPDSNSTYCWGCKQARDAIQWVIDYESEQRGREIEFKDALRKLEQDYNIRPPKPPSDLPDDDEDDSDLTSAAESTFEEICALVDGEDPRRSTSDITMRCEDIDDQLTRVISRNRDSPGDVMAPTLKLAYHLDNLRYSYEQQQLEREDAKTLLDRIENKVQKLQSKYT